MQPVDETDRTEDDDWLDAQTERLSGYDILRRVLSGNTELVAPGDLSDRVGITRHEATAIYKEKLVRGIMLKLGARNSREASVALEKILND
jgi:hypothetical protein